MNSPVAPWTELKTSEFEKIRQLAHREFGLDLKQGKEELVSARLGKLMRTNGFQTFGSYYDHVVHDHSGEALIEMIDALTTNHTSFLREPAHFEFLKQAIGSQFKNEGTLRIWSAACSTGEEPYSIAFYLLNEGLPASSFRILATDISTRALGKAQRGVYPAARFDPLPATWHRRFLLQGEGDWAGWYKVKPDVAATIDFRRLNLMEDWPAWDTYHVIFCRNVMMYFDRETQSELVRRMAGCLEPGGYFFVGHSESLSGLDHPLTYCQAAVYQNLRGQNSRGQRAERRRDGRAQ